MKKSCHLGVKSLSHYAASGRDIRSIKLFGPRSVRHVGPDLGPNCLQKLLADVTSRLLKSQSETFMH